jgi:hypothetical protein
VQAEEDDPIGFRGPVSARASGGVGSDWQTTVVNEVSRMSDQETRWVARLTPVPQSSIEILLGLSLGLDVWERHADALVVAASDAQLSEIERRRLAHVERLSTVAEFLARAQRDADSSRKENQQ